MIFFSQIENLIFQNQNQKNQNILSNGEEVLDTREDVGLQNGVVMSLESPSTSLEHVQNDVKDKFVVVLCITFGSGLVCGSLTNETMPWRQRGHAIEPGGPCVLVEAEFVEQ
ncbi:hypothetical protein A2U01_0028862, partial [Trifolium medium]|nr:hypothetical protein [Trifolium medium]